MSLTPSLQLNFDGVGLSDTLLSDTDAQGVSHLHKIKPGSEVVFDLKFDGVDLTPSKYEFRIEFRDTSAEGALLMVGNFPAQAGDDFVITKNIASDVERVRFKAPATAVVALDNRNGMWGLAVADTNADWQDTWVRGIWQTEPRPVKGLIDLS